ncbi:MAG TPA: DUF6054 family protein [Clostridia bacterium]|nr:DUF6054 family protein [Clostridia bacterium]
MSKYDFRIGISPEEALRLIKESQNADLVHEEFFDLGDGKCIGILVYEKYYFRASNRAALVVIVDNLEGYTGVRSISTGSSQGLFFNFDWGAADNFAESVKNILKDFID